MTPLFQSIDIGSFNLKHRVVLAPLTRMRAQTPGDLPTADTVLYYEQRASLGGLLISEATSIDVTARGYLGAPGIYSDEQVAAWKTVTDAVHAKGGRIFSQLWHTGRVGHSDMTGGGAPVAPSALPFEGIAFTHNGWVASSPARALDATEIPAIIEQHRKAAERAKVAGFDGVELHAANGYLLDKFLQDGSNQRTDSYGGSIENRVRLPIEILNALIEVWGLTVLGFASRRALPSMG